ncbi:MAG: FemAB family XrtA/PEP-CTERM system-associated protein [Bdellovibrionota bacterium]
MIEALLVTDSDRADWEQYLRDRSIGHHAYSWPWRTVIPEVFSHAPHYLIARDSQTKAVCGLLPIVLVKSLLFGKALISLPYLNAGGIVADSPEAATALYDRVTELGRELDVGYIELRHVHAAQCYPADLPVRTHKVSMHLALKRDPEELFRSFPPKLRSQVRRPAKDGMIAEVSGSSLAVDDSMQAFYQVFSEHMRDLGTPVYPRSLFTSVVRNFGKSCRTITVWHERRPVAAGITLGNGPLVEIPWASSLKKFSKSSPNMLLYWEAIKAACQDGYDTFDFGRSSPESGTFRFKQQWGATPVTLHWYYQLFRGETPDVNPKNPKYTALVTCWQRLPLSVANLVGPWLTRSIP